MNRGLRLIFGFVAAMIGAALVCSFMLTVLSSIQHAPIPGRPALFDAMQVFMWGTLIGLPFVTLGGLLIGIPIHIVMARRNICDLLSYGAAGALSGGVAGPGIIALLFHAYEGIPFAMALGGGGGLAAALIWWALVVRIRSGEAAGG